MPGSIPLELTVMAMVLVSEYRTACFIDRDKIRLHFEPPPTWTTSSVHESGHCRNLTRNQFFVSPVSPTPLNSTVVYGGETTVPTDNGGWL